MNFFHNFCKVYKTGTRKIVPLIFLIISPVYCHAEFYSLGSVIPGTRVVADIPPLNEINQKKRTRVIFFALPNGNTIEQSAGKILSPGDDWHYDIQHISAQTKFIREQSSQYNYITVYLEAAGLSWPGYASKLGNNMVPYRELVDSVCKIIDKITNGKVSINSQDIILGSHSGGGRFVFNYISADSEIPHKVKKIFFLDSVYGFEDEMHGEKLFKWLKSSSKNILSVISYIDTTVILDGKRIVSATGGTGYRSKMMYNSLEKRGMHFSSGSDSVFTTYNSSNGRARILIKENPLGKIYHTILVERNGFIQGVLAGDREEGKNYSFWGDRAYTPQIQDKIDIKQYK